jgi:hypothetical protein
MLLDIFVTVPSILMTNIAWYIRIGLGEPSRMAPRGA